MREDHARIGIDLAQGFHREYVVGALQHAARRARTLQMLQEAPVRAIALHVARLLYPTLVRGHVVNRLEAQAAKTVRGELRAFLRRQRIERMHVAQILRESMEEIELSLNLARPRAASGSGVIGVRVDGLPAARREAGVVFGEQRVQKR